VARDEDLLITVALPRARLFNGQSCPLITVSFLVRVQAGPPLKSVMCGHFENDSISALRTTRFRFENDLILDLFETIGEFLLDFFVRF
jgi:hypothetical protein